MAQMQHMFCKENYQDLDSKLVMKDDGENKDLETGTVSWREGYKNLGC